VPDLKVLHDKIGQFVLEYERALTRADLLSATR